LINTRSIVSYIGIVELMRLGRHWFLVAMFALKYLLLTINMVVWTVILGVCNSFLVSPQTSRFQCQNMPSILETLLYSSKDWYIFILIVTIVIVDSVFKIIKSLRVLQQHFCSLTIIDLWIYEHLIYFEQKVSYTDIHLQ